MWVGCLTHLLDFEARKIRKQRSNWIFGASELESGTGFRRRAEGVMSLVELGTGLGHFHFHI
jgi:hypothetical protein